MRLKRERVLADLSQAALAREAGLHPNTVSGTELKRLRPYPRQLKAMADAIGWAGDPEDLLEEVPNARD